MSDRQEDTGWWLASDGKWYPPESHPSARGETESGPTGQRVRYAGFWLRVWAFIIDGILISIATGILSSILGLDSGSLLGGLDEGQSAFGSGDAFSLVATWLYSALMESSATQATLGKMALSLKVTDVDGERITFGRATGRHFGKYVSAIILFFGFFMAGWTAKKQALHDMMAGTLVVRERK